MQLFCVFNVGIMRICDFLAVKPQIKRLRDYRQFITMEPCHRA